MKCIKCNTEMECPWCIKLAAEAALDWLEGCVPVGLKDMATDEMSVKVAEQLREALGDR